MASARGNKWLKLFEAFVSDIRISSKEELSTEERGVPLVLWESQKRALREIGSGLDQDIHKFNILKSRQLGVTTITLAIDVFWLAMHPNIIMCLVTDTEKNREANRALIQKYIDSFPDGYFGDSFIIKRNNRSQMQFSNGARLDLLVAGVKDKGTAWGEGVGYTAAHLTEVASYGSAEGLKSLEEGFAQKNEHRLFIYESPLALDTSIPTPSGWTTMEAIQPGDSVFNEDGVPCRVEGISPTFINRKCYRVEFDNGDSIVADAQHQWRVAQRQYKTAGEWFEKDVTTEELTPGRHAIYMTQPLTLDDVNLPIDPYLLGVWLGDGATAEPRISAGDEDIDEMKSLLEARGCKLGVVTKSENRCGMFHVLGVRNEFSKLGLLGNKHIPDQYLRASERQRRLLLAGLMDTDGSISRAQYQCNFSSTNLRLISQVCELLSSLGIKYVESLNAAEGKVRLFPQGHTSVCRESRRLLFSELPDRDVFLLPRKRRIQQTERRAIWRKSKRLRIVSVTEVPSVPVKCIAVDTPSHLFLAGRTMIPTHNTAKGFNHWHDRWKAGLTDITQRSFFIGWWSGDTNRIERKNPLFAQYGFARPDNEEEELIRIVRDTYNYKISPEQLAWIRWKTDSAGAETSLLEQNQPWTAAQAFVQSGQSFFQVRFITSEMRRLEENPEPYHAYAYDVDGDFYHFKMRTLDPKTDSVDDIQLKVWEEPDPNGRYVIGVDPAYGRNDHKDNHAIQVFRCFADKVIQVAEFATADIEAKHAAWVMFHLAAAYRDCLVNVEIGGPGALILGEFDHLRQLLAAEINERRTLERGWEDAGSMARLYIYKRPDSMGAGHVLGFQANGNTTPVMMHQLRGAYVSKEIEIKSKALLREMALVVTDDGHIGAPESRDPNCKDDRVFAMGLAVRAWKDNVQKEMLAMGQTYEAVMAQAAGEKPAVATQVNRIVFGFLKRMEDDADAEPPASDWQENYGL